MQLQLTQFFSKVSAITTKELQEGIVISEKLSNTSSKMMLWYEGV